MAKSEVYQTLESAMMIPTFVSLWPEIDQFYKKLNFQDVLPDRERIEEYKYISNQLAKFVGTHFEEFLSYEDDLTKLLEVIRQQIATPDSTVPNERKKIVYLAMRDEWLNQMWNVVYMLREQLVDEDYLDV